MNIVNLEMFKMAVGASLLIAVIIVIGIILGYIAAYSWKFIDDSDKVGDNLFFRILPNFNKKYKYKLLWVSGRLYGYSKDKRDDGKYWIDCNNVNCFSKGELIGLNILILAASPVVLFGAIAVYPITIAAIILTVVAYLARFTRRLSKAFDKHTKDANAHKGE